MAICMYVVQNDELTVANLEDAEVARHDEEHHHHEDDQEEAEEAHQHRLEEHHQRLAA